MVFPIQSKSTTQVINTTFAQWEGYMNWSEIILAVIAAIVAIVSGGIVIKSVSKNRSINKKSTRIVSQKNNVAQGDIIAGDSVKNQTRQ
jgi:hypothetical protein